VGVKVAFDIGGLISRYPNMMKELMSSLIRGGSEVFILTDMNPRDALAACRENGLMGFIGHKGIPKSMDVEHDWSIRESWILSADWSRHGDLCKSELMELYEIDILIDDRPDYAASGDFIGLVLSPRPDVPYYSPEWVNKSTPAVCVPPEEYEAFKSWKASRSEV
jgi:hypothetical protein